MGFCLGSQDLTDTNLERRIDQVIAMGKEKTAAYKLKSTTGVFNAHKSMYTPEQIKFIEETFSDDLYYFGYAAVSEDNPTGFYLKDAEHSEENLAKFYKFRQDNEDTMKYLTSAEYQVSTTVHNGGDELIRTTKEDLEKMMVPPMDQAKKRLEEAKAKKQQ